MTTDPTGVSFLSYRRSCVDDARMLIMAQHNVGIPTWQDLNNLGEGHTDHQLRAVLNEDRIANAIAYLTHDVVGSAVITRTELPGIVARADRNDGFFLVPVAARGLDYRDVTATVGTYLGTHDLSQWNIAKVLSNPLTHDDAVKIAQRVLRDRLGILHRALPAAEPLRFELHTRSAPAVRPGVALTLDWTHRFAGRQASADTWRDILIPACETAVSACNRYAPGRPLALAGFCALPAAIALGWNSWRHGVSQVPGNRCRPGGVHNCGVSRRHGRRADMSLIFGRPILQRTILRCCYPLPQTSNRHLPRREMRCRSFARFFISNVTPRSPTTSQRRRRRATLLRVWSRACAWPVINIRHAARFISSSRRRLASLSWSVNRSTQRGRYRLMNMSPSMRLEFINRRRG